MTTLIRLTLVLIALLLTSACAPVIDRAVEGVFESERQTDSSVSVELEPNVLTALQSGPLIDESLGSCITNDSRLTPQPFRLEGTPFRLEGTPFRLEGTPFRLEGTGTEVAVSATELHPFYVSDYLKTRLDASFTAAPETDVGILVLDNFGDGVFTLGQEVFAAKVPSAETLVDFEREGFSSHGAVVMNHIGAVLEGLGSYSPKRLSPDTVEWRHEDTGARIIVKGAAPRDFETGTVAAALERGLADLRAEGAERIVVNMSFIILPCSIVRDFVVQKLIYPSLFDYLGQAVAQNVSEIMRRQGVPFFLRDEVAERVSELVVAQLEPVDPVGDPLRLAMLAEPEVVFVGAAGNFGRGVSAYPAVWDEVLAVSAGNPEAKADFSNTGSVLLAGAWFRLVNPLGLNGHTLTHADIVYAGTSFAAPGVSVFAALDLATGGRCGLAEGRPRLSRMGASDTALGLAVAERCSP